MTLSISNQSEPLSFTLRSPRGEQFQRQHLHGVRLHGPRPDGPHAAAGQQVRGQARAHAPHTFPLSSSRQQHVFSVCSCSPLVPSLCGG